MSCCILSKQALLALKQTLKPAASGHARRMSSLSLPSFVCFAAFSTMPTNDLIDHIVRPKVANTEDAYTREGGSRYVSTYTPDSLPPEVARIVNGVARLFSARSMTEHCEIMGLLSKNLIWDAPPILTDRKGHLRVAAYLAKFAADLRLEPSLIQVQQLTHDRHVVEILGSVYLMPKRTILVWPTLLLPKELPIRCTIRLGVRGPLPTGQVSRV